VHLRHAPLDGAEAPPGALVHDLVANYAMHMTIEQVRKMHRASPFQPFDIHLVDGRSLPVEHPEFLAMNPPGRTISVGLSDGTVEVVDLLLVTGLKPRANGRLTRRRAAR